MIPPGGVPRPRPPIEVAHTLAAVYGHKLDPVVYTRGVAISGRLRLRRLDPAGRNPVPEIVGLACASSAKVGQFSGLK